ncbi:MAG TPA: dihydroneopterin aldolase [Spongiibacteraceae bacterium]|nr:dihydroneopterin aldolase [Spongiibacteraceae bacterium]
MVAAAGSGPGGAAINGALDWVFIADLRADTLLGIDPWEREVRQTIRLDLDMGTDIRAAAASQRIEDAINYHAVAARITAFLAQADYLLLESLAEDIADLVLAEFPVRRLRLRITKPGAVGNAAGVGVMIERPAAAG